jgi:hypothetical protein
VREHDRRLGELAKDNVRITDAMRSCRKQHQLYSHGLNGSPVRDVAEIDKHAKAVHLLDEFVSKGPES